MATTAKRPGVWGRADRDCDAIFKQCDDLQLPLSERGLHALALSLAAVDQAFHEANAGRSVEIPPAWALHVFVATALTTLVCSMPIGSAAVTARKTICLRASAQGWRHLLACDTFVFHSGEVSFGADS